MRIILFSKCVFRLGNMGGRGVLRRNYTGKKPVIIQHRTPDAANYYDHENVNSLKRRKKIFEERKY